jgi:autotransporter translocation and assembly factor TamB
MNTIRINGMSISASGNLSVINGKVFVNGVDVTPESKEINIVVTGNVEELKVDACSKVSITGEVGNIKTQSGDVDISGNVGGSVQTMSGDVDCGNISGSVSTMSGDVKHRRN